jgi:N-acetylglucosaminyldiphosphoundecaprenol N-acetyl-beta-D-mannosaminyltransferase
MRKMNAFLQNTYSKFKSPDYRHIFGMRVDSTSYKDATNNVITWAISGESRYVCAANVHMAMEAYDSQDFKKIINKADIVTPDGMPLVLILRILGLNGQKRVYGPTLMKHICEVSAQGSIPVGFYGGTSETLKALVHNLTDQIPNLKTSYAYSPPFRALTLGENEALVGEINSSGTQILFVGLGCPKQEWWMFTHRNRIKSVMIGVGAGFDFFAGTKKQAPKWMMRIGLEWLFRLFTEPKRLWRRYLYNNPRFLYLATLQLLNLRDFKGDFEK